MGVGDMSRQDQGNQQNKDDESGSEAASEATFAVYLLRKQQRVSNYQFMFSL
jgi:hypothetical protein